MRRFFRKYLLPLFLSLVLTSCFSEFEPDIESKPVLCMISNITEGDSIKVSLTHTWKWSDENGSATYIPPSGDYMDFESVLFVKNAQVKLYVNDQYKETLKLGKHFYTGLVNNGNAIISTDSYPWTFTGNIYYIAEYIPKCGDKIRLEAESEEYGSAWAEVTVPDTVRIDDVDYSVSGVTERTTSISEWYLFDMNFSVWFTDPAEDTNYYMFEADTSNVIRGEDEHGNIYWESVSFGNMTDDPLFTEHVSAIDYVLAETSGYTFFSDRQISGKSYPLHFRLESVNFTVDYRQSVPSEDKSYLKLVLYSISPSYYRHAISVWAANDGLVGSLGDVGLAEPVIPASNVSTGAGVVSASTKYEYKIYMRPLIESIQMESQQ